MITKISSKKDVIVIIVLIFILILTVIFSLYVIYKINGPSRYSIIETFKLNAIVIKVNEDTIDVMEKEGNDYGYHELYQVNFGKKGNIGFKQGQEVMIYHKDRYMGGMAYSSIYKVKKIDIIKEKSEIEIPKHILRFYYSSIEDVSIDVEEITKNSISVKIKDLNEIPFEYSKFYSIRGHKDGKEIVNGGVDYEGTYYNLDNYNFVNGNELAMTYNWKDEVGELKERKIRI